MENETLNILTNVFSNIAFPVACCIALFWLYAKQNNELRQTIERNTEILKELTLIIKNSAK